MSDDLLSNDIAINEAALAELDEISKTSETVPAPIPVGPVPKKVDLSEYLYYIRKQGGMGCWGYATLAVWDIMNEISCPYSPNLSMRLWLTLHRRPDLWKKDGGLYSPDGRFHAYTKGPEWGKPPLFQSYGCPTEGTEPTLHSYPSQWTDGGWTNEGGNEAYNYRLGHELKKLGTISSDEFIKWLNASRPIRIEGGLGKKGHVVAVVGYDLEDQTFKYANSYGDKWGSDGYGTFTFQQLDNQQPAIIGVFPVTTAYVLDKTAYIPPRPVPAARIAFKHTDRANVNLWLGVEDSPHRRNKIWPPGWNDNSCNLRFTVRLPSEFIWPPSKDNRLVLDLYDAATYSKTGGKLEEFTAAFGGHVFKCSQLSSGLISFKAREHLRLTIP